jgi:hypothetical protein
MRQLRPVKRIKSAATRTESIHAGPRLSPKANAISRQQLHLKGDFSLLPASKKLENETARDLRSIRECQDPGKFTELSSDLAPKYPSSNTVNPSSSQHGTE